MNNQKPSPDPYRTPPDARRLSPLSRQHPRGWHALILAIALLCGPSSSWCAEWESLFDGRTLKGWKITDFAGGGEVNVENGQLVLHSGVMLTGVSSTSA